MIEKQNITLSLPKYIVRKAKILAINHETSLSGLMARLLTDLVEKDEQYEAAKRAHLSWLDNSSNLATKGNMPWPRESLHER